MTKAPRERSQGLAALLRALLLLALVVLGGGLRAEAPLPEAPERWVTDTAGFLPPQVVARLDRRLAAYKAATGHQVLVYVAPTLDGASLEDWTNRAFASWKVGRKGMDDGLALFLFSRDHRIRMEVGYGLEGQMPDAMASRIIREAILPRLKAGDPGGALMAGVDRILGTLGGEREMDRGADRGRYGRAPAPPLPLGAKLVLALLALGLVYLFLRHPDMMFGFLLGMLFSGRGRGGGWGGGGGGGWGGGGGDGFSGGGGSSGGGGASDSW